MSTKLDDIKPLSAMSIEPIDPIISQFLDFNAVFGGDNPFDKAVPADADVRAKSAALRKMAPDAVELPTIQPLPDDLYGMPSP
ncbi:hypothetical protein RBE51_18210 [Pseudomonas taiwanensis]|uniref:hypothetical protein n=1 Tax=Pseudomonas taiwanensis TaxID=470150 RepID=UPI0028DFC797|nr:hypothetical protein [Pseudomonas taiwanensis]MDT8924730.1 hypothetical protein [Pseudomonas taiwanensis]